jgi:gamma-glutamyltranspeptidase / glutathione hydrolase
LAIAPEFTPGLLGARLGQETGALLANQGGMFLAAALAVSLAGQSPVTGLEGMVVSDKFHASEVGAEILRKGGNAVDAAVATGLALAVVQPSAGNIGGGGFMLIRMADGREIVIDYREVAPGAATRNMFLDAEGKPTQDSTIGYRAAGIPGTVAGFGEALSRYGTMRWRDVVAPAVRLAEEGFEVTPALESGLRGNASLFNRFPESRRIFTRNGNFYRTGDTFRQPELARTLARIRDRGPREFYTGETARLIEEDMKANGGLVTRADLAAYRPILREPLRGNYRGHQILTVPPPSSGGAVLIQMLNVLEGFDLGELDPLSSQRYHLHTEAMKRAFADRAQWMGDPGYFDVPVAWLTSRSYAHALRARIDPDLATPSKEIRHGEPPRKEGTDTTHYSVVDRHGNAVANTYTINTGYGSGAVVKGAGFLLNNEMDDFTSKPGSPNVFGLIQGEANAIAPGKRPLSSMTPTMVLKDGKLLLLVGSPGGPTIINTVLTIITNVVDHGMNVQQAVVAPRFHHQWMPDTLRVESFGTSSDVIEALRKRGHDVSPGGNQGAAQCILIHPTTGRRLGAADPRQSDSRAVGH